MTNRKLLFSVTIKDCKVETIAATKGAGGQRKNAKQTAVRITHPPSGAVGYSADERDQLRNKREAWLRLGHSEAFRKWQRVEVARLRTGKSVDEIVEEMLDTGNLRIEVHTSTGWKIVPANAPLDEAEA